MIILLIIGTEKPGEAFRVARRIAVEGKEIIILFIGEGARIAEDPYVTESLDFARLYALADDCPKPAPGVELVNYDGWVRLLEYCGKTISWT
jgi:hypothetical protein